MQIDFHIGRRSTPKVVLYFDQGIHLSLGYVYLELCVMGNGTQPTHNETSIQSTAETAGKG